MSYRYLIFSMTILLLAIGGAVPARCQQNVIVAFGDSTTAPRGELTAYPTLVERSLSGKGIAVRVVNSGVPGNTTEDARKRFEKDVLVEKPNVVIIQFGINDSAVDVWRDPPATSPRVSRQDFQKNLRHFVRTLKNRGVSVVLMTPNPLRWTDEMKKVYGKSPYQPNSADGFNVLLAGYADIVREVSRKEEVPLVDVYRAFLEYGEQPDCSVDDLLLDGIHPNNKGQELVAKKLLPCL